MSTIVLTPVMRDMARHALGLPNRANRSYRNHFVTGAGTSDHAVWMAMVENGAAKRRSGSPLTGGDDVFALTADGARAALRKTESLCREDFPVRPAP